MCSLMVTVRKSRLVGVCRDIRWPVFLLWGMEFRTMRSDWKGGFMSKVVKGSLISDSSLAMKIDEYRYRNGEPPNYVVVSSDTLTMLKNNAAYYIANFSGYGEYWGIPVAVCDKLVTGQFELV